MLSDVIVATDSEEILQACRGHGWKAQMTQPLIAVAPSGCTKFPIRFWQISTSTCKATNRSCAGTDATLLEVMHDQSVQWVP